ncbi:MAG: phage tail tube protein [Deltaproteobacteria bacterium]|nr:phage tail tube protein [Deltaproteobacteria bacterium]
MLTRKRVILAKIEANEGTPETLGVSNNPVLMKDVRVSPRVDMYERGVIINTLSKLPSIPGGRLVTVSFSTEIKGRGQAYSSSVFPAITDYLRACGFSATFSGSSGQEKYTFTPLSGGIPSLTIGIYEDGIVHRIAGARGTVSFTGTIGEPVIASFEFTGVWIGTQDASLPSPTLDLGNPPICMGSVISIDGSFSPVVSKFSLDMANTLEPRRDISAAQGYRSVRITGRSPRGQIDPEGVLVSVFDFYGKWRGGESFSLNLQVGSTQYNRVKFDIPKARITEITEDERNGILVYTVNFDMTMVQQGDDEITIIFD